MKFGTPKSCPITSGTPSRPATIEPTASTCSGTIIVFGDSCRWCAWSAVPRKLPPKVIQYRRNM